MHAAPMQHNPQRTTGCADISGRERLRGAPVQLAEGQRGQPSRRTEDGDADDVLGDNVLGVEPLCRAGPGRAVDAHSLDEVKGHELTNHGNRAGAKVELKTGPRRPHRLTGQGEVSFSPTAFFDNADNRCAHASPHRSLAQQHILAPRERRAAADRWSASTAAVRLYPASASYSDRPLTKLDQKR